MYSKYYQEELAFLREMSRECADKYPVLGNFLTGQGSDPDVERLLEGFAFLTGRLRQKLDDELPELTHTLIELLWPHYLRPVPSLAIVEFAPKKTVREPHIIPRLATEIESVPVKADAASRSERGTRCRFRTCYDVELLPLVVDAATLEGQQLRLRFRLMGDLQFAELNLQRLRLYLHGDPALRSTLYLWLSRHVRQITVQATGAAPTHPQLRLSPSHVHPVGFNESDGLLPYAPNTFIGYRVLQEYFAFPDKFMFIDVTGLAPAADLGIQNTFEMIFHLSRWPRAGMRVDAENFRLHCTPVVNLLDRRSKPIRVAPDRTEYQVRPEGPNGHHYQVYSVNRVVGWVQGTAQQREYVPFYAFTHGLNRSPRERVYYHVQLRSSVINEEESETYLSFVDAAQSRVLPPTEMISVELTCMNPRLTEKLSIGDIRIPTGNSPGFAEFRNITNVTASIHLPLDGRLHWQLISHLSLNRLSISAKEALQGILALYNFQEFFNRPAARENRRRLEGIVDMQSTQTSRLYLGSPIRGRVTRLKMQEDHFAGEGDMYLFACVLNEFFALYTTLNSFSQLIVDGVDTGENYAWPPRIGRETLLREHTHG